MSKDEYPEQAVFTEGIVHSFLPFGADHVWLLTSSLVAVIAERQEAAGLDSPAGRSGLFLCIAESPQVQCPGLV